MVGSVDGRFVDVEAEPSTRALAARLKADGVKLEDGQRGEICLALDGWIARAAVGLRRGLLLLIDYGHPAAELYDPVRRRDGTLRAYLRHRVHDDPYRHVGRQDLTAHVDVDAVERAAREAGLGHLGTTTQAEFLVGYGMEGLLQAIQADPDTTLESYLAVRSAVMRLLDPGAMGRFRVMGFGRDWPAGPRSRASPIAWLDSGGPGTRQREGTYQFATPRDRTAAGPGSAGYQRVSSDASPARRGTTEPRSKDVRLRLRPWPHPRRAGRATAAPGPPPQGTPPDHTVPPRTAPE